MINSRRTTPNAKPLYANSTKQHAITGNQETSQRFQPSSSIDTRSRLSQINSCRGLRTVLAISLVVLCLLGAASTAWAQLRQASQIDRRSLDYQLKESRVIPGSALERLIRENQEFNLLNPSESRDNIIAPLWLRVWWRKAHPELRYSSEDPTGGYPLVLKEIWEWMVTHQDLVPGNPQGPGHHGLMSGPAAVGPDQRISGAQTTPRSESNIRVNRRNPNLIIAGSNNIQASGQQAQFFSTNGGANWNQTSLPLNGTDDFHSDPTVEWTSDGTAWATTIGIHRTPRTLTMKSYRSADNGATWTFDSIFSGTQTATDKQLTWVDHSLISPFRDNMYATWHNGAPVFFNRRTGGAWQTPVQLSGAETTGTGIGGDVRTNSAGEVFVFWPDTGSRRLFMRKSTDGGATFAPVVTIATTFDAFDIGIPAMNSRRAFVYISAGAYKTASTSYVFASWTDLSGDTGCTSSANEPGGNTASTCKMRVWFARSTDGGSTWSAPSRINNPSSNNDQFMQFLVVDETNGRVAIMYYDTVDDAGRLRTNVYYQSSSDFGATWSTADRVTSAQTDESVAGSDFGNQYGDYNGLSGLANTFFPSWTDRRNNAREEVWTAGITETGGTGPDPSILPWGVDRVPPAPPWWQTSDIWVDNDADGVLNEPGEPSRGLANNQLFARVTNVGSAAASGYRVVFKFKPYTTSASAPAVLIASVDELGTLAPGASRNYSVNWDLTDAFIQSHFANTFWTADHFCVQITIESSSSSPLNDVNPVNNFAQSNFDNVPVSRNRASAQFFLYNHLNRAAVAGLEVGPAKGWQVRLDGINDPAHITMQPNQWIAVTAILEAGSGATMPQPGSPVLIDIVQTLDRTRVGGLTLGLLPASVFPNPPPPAQQNYWYIGGSIGAGFPISSMQNRFKPGFALTGQIERGLNPNSRLGFQIGYHAFNAKTVVPPIPNLRITNLSGYGRFLSSTGSVRPFGLVGIGGYRFSSAWHFGVQTGAGLEFPITNRFSITTGGTFHFVNSNPTIGTTRWVDATVGFMYRIPH